MGCFIYGDVGGVVGVLFSQNPPNSIDAVAL